MEVEEREAREYEIVEACSTVVVTDRRMAYLLLNSSVRHHGCSMVAFAGGVRAVKHGLATDRRMG